MLCVESMEKVYNDAELQNWGAELCQSKESGGAGLKVLSAAVFVVHICYFSVSAFLLIDCTHLGAVRQTYFRVDTPKELFEITDSQNIIAFIKDINFYHHIITLILY